MIEVRHIRPAAAKFAPLSFSVPAGSCLAIQGASGIGKSLLLRAIADLDPWGGDLFLNGVSCHQIPAPQWRRQVGYVPAEPGWWADKVGDHLPVTTDLTPMLTAVGLSPALLDQPVTLASTGERTRLGLIRALCANPKVLCLDEPTAALDHGTALKVEALIAERQAQGLAVLWVTHDQGQAGRIGQQQLNLSHPEPEQGP